MAQNVVELHNVSVSLVNVTCGVGSVDANPSDVNYQKSGQLGIPPKEKVRIEEARINLGQIENLRQKNILKFTRTVE